MASRIAWSLYGPLAVLAITFGLALGEALAR